MRHLAFLSLLFMAMAPAAMAAPAAIAVETPWIRHVPGRENAAAYVTLTAANDDALSRVTSDCCAQVEIHEMTMDGDVMQMRAVKEIALPKGMPVALAPTGYHLMLLGLKEQPTSDSTLKLTLHFASGATQEVAFTVKPLMLPPATKQTPAAHEHGGHH